MTRQLVRIGMAVMVTLLAVAAVWQFRQVVSYIVVSLALAAAVRPLAVRLARRSPAARVALILLCLVALAGFALLLVLSGGAAIRDMQELVPELLVQDAWQQPGWLQGSSFQQLLDTRLPAPSQLFVALIGDQGQFVLPAVLGFTQGIFTVVSGGLVVLFLSLYWTMAQDRFARLWLSLLPPGQRTQAREIWQAVESDLGAYIRSEVTQSLLAGLLLGVGYWLLASPYPALLAVAGALALLIPMVGAPLALLPPLLLGLLSSVSLTFATISYTLVVVGVLKFWVEPRLAPRKVHNPMLTLVFLIALADAYGLLGIVAAPPLSAACQILWQRLVSRPGVSVAPVQLADIKERQMRVWATIKAMDEPAPPTLSSSMARLAELVEKVESTVGTADEPGGMEPSRQQQGG